MSRGPAAVTGTYRQIPRCDSGEDSNRTRSSRSPFEPIDRRTLRLRLTPMVEQSRMPTSGLCGVQPATDGTDGMERLTQLWFSRIVLSRARSFWFALRIAAAMIGAAILPNPLGSPEFRSVMRVPPDSVSCHE